MKIVIGALLFNSLILLTFIQFSEQLPSDGSHQYPLPMPQHQNGDLIYNNNHQPIGVYQNGVIHPLHNLPSPNGNSRQSQMHMSSYYQEGEVIYDHNNYPVGVHHNGVIHRTHNLPHPHESNSQLPASTSHYPNQNQNRLPMPLEHAEGEVIIHHERILGVHRNGTIHPVQHLPTPGHIRRQQLRRQRHQQ